MSQLQEVVDAWQPYIDSIDDWRSLVEGIEPKETGCGPVYELDNPIEGRPNESFAVADMSNIDVAEPHFHANGESEIYFVLVGIGLVVVGGEEREVEAGDVVVTPPDTAHFTLPRGELVLAVVNTPPFKPENYVSITETNEKVGFDSKQLERLTANE